MRRLTLFASTAALVLLTATNTFVQTRPDFSGTWVLDPATAPASPLGEPGTGPFPFGAEFTAKQDANTLTVTGLRGPVGDQPVTTTYRFDGTETRTQFAGRSGGPPQEVVSTVRWQDHRLAIASELQIAGNTIALPRVLSMEDGNLVIEMTAQSPLGGPPTTTRVVYTRKLN